MNKIHLIGNAHLDPVWLWQWTEGYTEVKATFKSALDRMNEFDDFKFTSAASVYYMWIEESDPEMFSDIQRRVKEGRWCISGGQLIQPDCNLPSGESFARHALISQRYFYEKFGVIAHTGYNVDSFGHNASMPKLLKNSGMNNYVFMRPMPHEKDLPSYLFDWVSYDGSSVKTYRIPEFYNIDMSRLEVFSNIEKLSCDIPMMAFYGVGNHGGGATVELLDKMHKTLSDSFIYSTPDEYFEDVKNIDVPTVYNDDLQFHAKGCYSALSELKTNNRKAENMLMRAENYSVLSNYLMETPYKKEDMRKAWIDVLFNQFHDILGGCCIREAYEDAEYYHHEAMAIADRNINFDLTQISWNIDTMNGKEIKPYKQSVPPVPSWHSAEDIGTPVVVFNSLPFAISKTVFVRDTAKYITDEKGNVVPYQLVRDSKTNVDDKFKLAFTADVPALGYSVYRMYFYNEKEANNTDLKAYDNVLENSVINVTFNKEKGELSSLFDKRQGAAIINKDCFTVLMDETHCDTWAHDIAEFKNLYAMCKKGSVKVIEEGPVRATIRCIQEFENTKIIRDYSITPESDEVTVNTFIDFREKHKMLKFSIPVNTREPKAFCEIPYGFIEKPIDGKEQASQEWIALTGDKSGIGVATTSQYSFDAEDNILSLTVLRGAIYADHFGNRDEFCEYTEQGEHRFKYSIFPYTKPADAVKRSMILNNEPTAVIETFHKGKLGTSFKGINVSESNIIVTAIKPAEDGNGIVLRCFEADNKDTNVSVKLFEKEFSASFKGGEVKTFLINEDGVFETSFMEWKK